MVEESIGYAITLVNTSCDSNLCFKPLEPRLEFGLNIVWKKHQVFSAAADLFLKVKDCPINVYHGAANKKSTFTTSMRKLVLI